MAEFKEGFQGRQELSNPLAVSAMCNAKKDASIMYLESPNPVEALNFTDEETDWECKQHASWEQAH